MKSIFLSSCAFLIFSCSQAQVKSPNFTLENFDLEFLKYIPVEKEGISKKSFEHGKMIILETQKLIKGDPKNYNVADYWNIATAFSSLQETKENIKTAFLKASESEGVCDYYESFENVKNHFKRHFPELYNQKKLNCVNVDLKDEDFDSKSYSIKNNLDQDLVKIISEIKNRDRKFRKSNYKDNMLEQRQLDLINQKIIDSLFHQYKTYIGKSLVGKKLENEMWAVIQHSNLGMMEKYLPIIHKAVIAKEVQQGILKMLLDRYYGLKNGYQIYGSQSGFGFSMATDKQRKEVELKYGIE